MFLSDFLKLSILLDSLMDNGAGSTVLGRQLRMLGHHTFSCECDAQQEVSVRLT